MSGIELIEIENIRVATMSNEVMFEIVRGMRRLYTNLSIDETAILIEYILEKANNIIIDKDENYDETISHHTIDIIRIIYDKGKELLNSVRQKKIDYERHLKDVEEELKKTKDDRAKNDITFRINIIKERIKKFDERERRLVLFTIALANAITAITGNDEDIKRLELFYRS